MTFKKNLTFAKQGKNFRALLMYMIWFDPHENPVCLIASLKQTMRLPCCCTCYSLCLKCPFPQGCWETLTDLLKPRSIMTSLGKGEVLVWLLLGTKAIISPKVLYTEGFLAITRWKCVCLKPTPRFSDVYGRSQFSFNPTNCVEIHTQAFQHKNSGAVSLITLPSLTENVLK